ncbi:hypothetical protein SYNPS1DRAFT_28139 [Syncephalis pseudoplumigaleata]|uniref:Uncharacterized protein n=1 Tax=Syncephalis pseudoplumigaleata TaxID=1712513 RepID=A0A4P9Z2Y1_9FUNG|nr:hypothetical protein SYNPS1DRAFT_28139 [Syncephalis pseudoplumigaleata]|eukprot:RKP26151.1 hypothetical protein SYNPS1DRAFT_28139 [Syncephalis pseudoplumigaleata]
MLRARLSVVALLLAAFLQAYTEYAHGQPGVKLPVPLDEMSLVERMHKMLWLESRDNGIIVDYEQKPLDSDNQILLVKAADMKTKAPFAVGGTFAGNTSTYRFPHQTAHRMVPKADNYICVNRDDNGAPYLFLYGHNPFARTSS